MTKKVVIPISGGIDSTTLIYKAVNNGYEVYPIFFKYGQKHYIEYTKAWQTCNDLNLSIWSLDLSFFKEIASTSSLTNDSIQVAKTKDVLGDAQTVNYVPFRNQLFVTIACARAEVVNADEVWHGAALVDSQAGYWDGSKEFLTKINELIGLNRKSQIKVEAPLIELDKKEIIQLGIDNNVNFKNTWTCYDPQERQMTDEEFEKMYPGYIRTSAEQRYVQYRACGECPACSSRIKGFIDLEYIDPVEYARDIPWSKYNCKVI